MDLHSIWCTHISRYDSVFENVLTGRGLENQLFLWNETEPIEAYRENQQKLWVGLLICGQPVSFFFFWKIYLFTFSPLICSFLLLHPFQVKYYSLFRIHSFASCRLYFVQISLPENSSCVDAQVFVDERCRFQHQTTTVSCICSLLGIDDCITFGSHKPFNMFNKGYAASWIKFLKTLLYPLLFFLVLLSFSSWFCI